MSVLTLDQQQLQPHVRLLGDDRPPALTWCHTPPAVRPAGTHLQPPLVFEPATDSQVASRRPRPSGHRVRVVAASSEALPPPELPDPRAWSASLALAFAEALQGQRPVGQLSRWVDERVLAVLNLSVRRLRRPPARTAPSPTRPARLLSVHLQFPRVGVVETSAHVHLSGRSSALAFRLEAWHDRWLCTVLELAPRDREV